MEALDDQMDGVMQILRFERSEPSLSYRKLTASVAQYMMERLPIIVTDLVDEVYDQK